MRTKMLFAQMSTKELSLFVFTYHALLTTLFAVCPLDIKHKNFASIIISHPDSFSCLLAAVILIHYIKLSVEQKIEYSA